MAALAEDSSPVVEFPRIYNAATDFIDRHLSEGNPDKIAVIDDTGSYSYGDLAARVNRAGNALRALGVRQETRVAMIMLDSIDFPAVFWGCLKIGAVPIPINTLLTADAYAHVLGDSRAQLLVVSAALYDKLAPVLKEQPFLEHIVVVGGDAHGHQDLAALTVMAGPDLKPATTTCDDVAFWLYSSGSTGAPKGVRHLHSHLRCTAELYARAVLGIEADDVIFSAAKLFFAYGLGNGMTFPFAVGATAIYLAERPTPQAVMRVMREHRPTLYCGVPTLFAAILADPGNCRDTGSARLRRCISAGEALPEEVGKRWDQRFGAQILDGVGSTEMLHIFLSSRPGQVRYGTSGVPVPGYQARLVDEEGRDVPVGEIGELLVNGPSAAEGYWNQRAKSLDTFVGRWTRTGDKYYVDADGYYHYCGRADDMLKVSGNWVSPFEVESALIAHEAVLEAAVIPHTDADGLIKPKAYVVLKDGVALGNALVEELRAFVKERVGPWKYPRWINVVDSLPKTATGKIQRFKLRRMDRGET